MDKIKLTILKLAYSNIRNSLLYKTLANCGGDVEKTLEQIASLDSNINFISDAEAEEYLNRLEKIGAKLITFKDELYPAQLRHLGYFPLVLNINGNEELLKDDNMLAIIGSRSTSSNNFNFAIKIAKEIGEAGYKVVSGLARGIDTAAHSGSINTGTVAVLGTGLDITYPKENVNLQKEIINKGGLVITEFALGTPPRAENFPSRNRIIVGLAKSVLIVDAGIISGTLQTANIALKLGREIMVFPGSPYDQHCAGSNKLLQQGATMVLNSRDIIDVLNTAPDFSDLRDNFNITNFDFNDEGLDEIEVGRVVAENYNGILSSYNLDYEENQEEEEAVNYNFSDIILQRLDYTPISLDDLADELPITISQLNAELVSLELEGRIIIDGSNISLRERRA